MCTRVHCMFFFPLSFSIYYYLSCCMVICMFASVFLADNCAAARGAFLYANGFRRCAWDALHSRTNPQTTTHLKLRTIKQYVDTCACGSLSCSVDSADCSMSVDTAPLDSADGSVSLLHRAFGSAAFPLAQQVSPLGSPYLHILSRGLGISVATLEAAFYRRSSANQASTGDHAYCMSGSSLHHASGKRVPCADPVTPDSADGSVSLLHRAFGSAAFLLAQQVSPLGSPYLHILSRGLGICVATLEAAFYRSMCRDSASHVECCDCMCVSHHMTPFVPLPFNFKECPSFSHVHPPADVCVLIA